MLFTIPDLPPPAAPESAAESEPILAWLESALPRIMRRLMGSEDLDMPLLQLPLAQMRLAQALYQEDPAAREMGETMGHLSERLGVRQNALTQAADRLINHGLAERCGDPQDRRIVRLRLTAQGQEWVRERRARRRANLRKFWEALPPEERNAVLQALQTLEAVSTRLSGVGEGDPARTEETVTGKPELCTIEETLSRFTADAVLEAGEKEASSESRDKLRQR